MLTDIEIAQSAKMKPIAEIAAELGISDSELVRYGDYKAKVRLSVCDRLKDRKNGKLVLVTAINPTPAGEGKTTVSIGLAQALKKVGKTPVLALREPSLGPVFGVKGGAAGGGYSQVVPMEDINLHFTGDMHAITAANNLLSAMLDNHLTQGNALNIDERRIVFPRVLDLNDRALRNVIIGLGGKANGVPREEHFTITVASEIMAILCLSTDLNDLKEKLGSILVAYTRDNKPVFARDLKAEGAMALLLKDALEPNLVQSLENVPAFVHGGPFANIAHGCNSINATRTALKLGDYCVTEAGFGSDLGAEKFLDIKCRIADLKPDTVVIVATCRSFKYNGGVKKEDLKTPNVEALKVGSENLRAHIANIKAFGITPIVAINRFYADTDEEIAAVAAVCESENVPYSVAEVFAKGGEGGIDLANKVIEVCEASDDTPLCFSYDLNAPVKEKIEALCKRVYGADGAVFDAEAEKNLKEIDELGFNNFYICVAKTQYSLSDDMKKLCRPKGFKINVKKIRILAGAKFLVVLTGEIMTMPGLPKVPAAESIDVSDDGTIVGLF